MAVYEKKFSRDGIPMSVQYLLIRQNGARRTPRLHYHEYTELLFGISGVASVTVENRNFDLLPGAMAIIHSGDAHDVTGTGAPCCYHVVKFLPDILLTGVQSLPEYGYVLMLMANSPAKQFLFDAGDLAGTEVPLRFDTIREEWERQEFGYELSLRADVTRIFLYILRHWRERNPEISESMFLSGRRELMQTAITCIREQFSDITEEKAAHICGVSAPYFSRIFKKSMRISFSDYLTSVRLREAERLLITTDESITDIAQSVGFSTSAYFISVFRKNRSVTPYRYRIIYRADI